MPESDTSPMILQPTKNEALRKSEAAVDCGILDEAELARLQRLAVERKEKKTADYAMHFMMRELYLPIRRAVLEEKHEFVLEYDFPLDTPPRNLGQVIKLAEEKMPAITFTLEIDKRFWLFALGDVGFFRITARW
jgi:hypothetical protein